MLRVVLLLPSLAFAQTTTTAPLDITVNGASEVTLQPSTCSLSLTARWTRTTTSTACEPLKLWATEGECGETPGANDVRYADVPVTDLNNGYGDFQVRVSQLPGFKLAETACGLSGVEKTHKICGALIVTTSFDCSFSTSRSTLRATPAELVYDTLAPVAPTLDAAQPSDRTILASFSAADDALTVVVQLKGPADADFYDAAEASVSSGSARISFLSNGVTYEVRAVAVDRAGNRSEPSNVIEAMPRETQGFWAAYRDAGGAETGCAHAPALFPAALVLLLARLKRKTR